MKKSKISILSIITGAICIGSEVKINYDIARRYLTATGKTRALFGLTEITTFFYRYYFLIIAILALLLALYALKRKEVKFFVFLAIGISLIALVSVFVDLWPYMV